MDNKPKKERLDVILVNRGLAESRERAKSLIMAGLVIVNEQKIDKAGTMVKDDAKIRLLGDNLPYVSRGGLKLEKAIKEFHIDLKDKAMADIGASTGGFTDCALQNGAAKVYAIDVGYGQLAWKLRQDSRVINMERKNIRFITPDDIGELLNFASIDVAFISLKKVLGTVKELLIDDGEAVALIKPQFEAGRENVGKKGVVKDPQVHEKVVKEIVGFCRSISFAPIGLTYSPIKGPEGNIEYLLYLSKNNSKSDCAVNDDFITDVINHAHEALDKH